MRLNSSYISIIRMLANRMSYQEIAAEKGIRLDCLHAHLWKIRQQSGIKDTKDVIEIREWLAAYGTHGFGNVPQWGDGDAPTPAQRRVMELMAKGMGVPHIARELDLKEGTVDVYASEGCRRAKILAKGAARVPAIREYLGVPSTNIDDY